MADLAAKRTPPIAERRPHAVNQHGEMREDPYAWLRAHNWREVMRGEAPPPEDVRAHLEAENAHVDAWFADAPDLADTLFAEMRARIKEDDVSLPVPDGPWAYQSRHRTGGQYAIFARRARDLATDAIGEEEHILFDGDKEAEGTAYFDLGGLEHSPDHRYLAYAVDLAGAEVFEIRVRDLETGEDLPDRLPDANGRFVWANDSRTLFYVEQDEDHRPRRIRRHVLGADPASAPVVYEEPDPGFFVSVSKTESDALIVVDSHDHTTSEVRLLSADEPTGPLRLVAARDRDVEYDLTDNGDTLYVHTNLGGAVDFQIMTAPVNAPARENWRPLIPHRDGVLILGVAMFARHMVRLERVEGLPRLIVRRLADGDEHAIAFDEAAYALGLAETIEFDTNVMRFTYASPTTPDQVFAYDMETRERGLLKTREVPSGHDPADYRTARIQAPAPDGETVPVTILHHKDTPLDGSAPCLLYGYGAYGITIPADFRTGRLSLVDRGIVYAIAHVRGGMAKGYRWYLDGRGPKKMNTFTDFVAAAEALVAHDVTARGKIVAMGGSAGGLLVGAALNLDPSLWAGAVAAVPFVDVLNTMSDETLPLTPPEWPEWGNPIEDKDAYAAIAAYSPYDNIAAQAYPPIFALAGLSDPRVTYWEPAKWIARLRETATGGGPFLLKTNMEAGHAGASGRWDALKETAREYAFVVRVAGKA